MTNLHDLPEKWRKEAEDADPNHIMGNDAYACADELQQALDALPSLEEMAQHVHKESCHPQIHDETCDEHICNPYAIILHALQQAALKGAIEAAQGGEE